MELRRFFIDKNKIIGKTAIIDNDEVHHITKVLRFKKGFKLILCVGDNNDYFAEITDMQKDIIECKIEKVLPNNSKALIDVDLYPAVIKQDNFELIIQKAVELGVNSITPLYTKNVAVKKLNFDRIKKITRDACKQSGRADCIEVKTPICLDELIKKVNEYDINLLAFEKERKVQLKDLISGKDYKKISLTIGPEGGFDDSEKEIIKSNFKVFTLGRRILRAETANIVSLGNIMYELDK